MKVYMKIKYLIIIFLTCLTVLSLYIRQQYPSNKWSVGKEVAKLQDKLGSEIINNFKKEKNDNTLDNLSKSNQPQTVKVNKSKESTRSPKKACIIIDPGHGGEDLGTVKDNLFEKNINLDISQRLKDYLYKDGFSVLMTREKDIFLAKDSKIKGTLELRDLNARANILNRSFANIFISIHVDSFPSDKSMNGSIVYYDTADEASKSIAKYIQKELNNVTLNGTKRLANNPSTADFYIFRNSSVPGVLIETGFITNKLERDNFLQSKFRDNLAKAIFEGIRKYFSIN